MSILRFARRHWILLAAPLSAFACIPQPTAPAAARPTAAPVVSTDIRKLGQIITLPRRPLQAVWQQETIGDGNMGPSDTRLNAVLLFSARDLKAIADSSWRRGTLIPASDTRDIRVAMMPWYPAPLRKKTVRGIGGRSVLKVRQLDAGDFYKLSLRNGELFLIVGTNYCVLSLFTT